MGFLRDSKGFTLIELMVTLALLGLVVAGGFSVYYFADRSFMSGSEMADVQADVQLAMRQITEEVRLAHSLKLMTPEDVPSVVAHEDDHYLFSKDGSVFLRTSNSPPDRVILNGGPEAGYGVSFGTVGNDGEYPNMLAVTVSSENPKVDYELSSELQILNLRLAGIDIPEGTSTQEAIYFTKDFSEEELEEVDRVNPGCIYRRRVYSKGAPELDHLRRFRDDYLAKNPLGRFAIQVYYAASPVVSSFLDHQPLARDVTTGFLRGLAKVAIRIT